MAAHDRDAAGILVGTQMVGARAAVRILGAVEDIRQVGRAAHAIHLLSRHAAAAQGKTP